jgi:threonine dehydratase
MRDTIVDGLATRTPVEAKVRDVKNLVDGVVLVTAEQMMRAMEVPLREQHVLTELPGDASTPALLQSSTDCGDRMGLVVGGATDREKCRNGRSATQGR